VTEAERVPPSPKATRTGRHPVSKSVFVVGMILLLLATMSGCGRTGTPTKLAAPQPESVVAFDSGHGTGPYDEMTYARYSSEIAFTASEDLVIRSIRPEMSYCNGSSGFLVFVRDENYGYLGAEAGIVDGSGPMTPEFADRHLDGPVTLTAGKTYLIMMEVWT